MEEHGVKQVNVSLNKQSINGKLINYVSFNTKSWIINFTSTFSNAKHVGKYWNRPRGKRDFKEFTDKDYRTYGFN